MRKGTLIMVTKPKGAIDESLVRIHGPLWLTIRDENVIGGLVACKSIATGEEYMWFNHEFEEQADGADDNT